MGRRRREGSFPGRDTQLCPCVVRDEMTQRGAMSASPHPPGDTGSHPCLSPCLGVIINQVPLTGDKDG